MEEENWGGLGERHGSKFKMAPQQAHPPQTGGQLFRAKKVLVAERGVLPQSHIARIQLRTRQNPRVETRDIHLPSESSFQMCDQIRMHAVGPHQKRHPGLQGDDDEYHRQRWFPPLLQLGHLARKFRRLMHKKVGASLYPERIEEFACRCFLYSGSES